MKEKNEDRRIMRTRNMLFDAFIDLMIEKGYEAITVQDIIDRANIGRSTFYLHFTDKEHLLKCNIEMLRELLIEQRPSQDPFEKTDGHKFRFSLAMLQHVQSHKRLYKAIVGKKGGSLVMYHMQSILSGVIQEDIDALLPYSSLLIPQETIIDFVVNTFMTLLTWWMNQNMPCSAKEVDIMFQNLTLSGLNGLK